MPKARDWPTKAQRQRDQAADEARSGMRLAEDLLSGEIKPERQLLIVRIVLAFARILIELTGAGARVRD